MPDQDFYNLKHRAIQWMVNPIEEDRLGLDPATVARGCCDGPHLDPLESIRAAVPTDFCFLSKDCLTTVAARFCLGRAVMALRPAAGSEPDGCSRRALPGDSPRICTGRKPRALNRACGSGF
jgi:hypothetical protein